MFDDYFSCPLAQVGARPLARQVRTSQPWNHVACLKIFTGLEDFSRSGKTFSNGTLRIPRNVCWAENALLIARQSQSGRPLGSRDYIATRSLPFFFSRALSPHPPFFCHLYPSPSHTSSSSFPSSVFFSPLSSLSLFPPLPFPSLFHAFLSQVFISTLLSLLPPPLAPLPFPPFYFSLFNKNSHVCAFEVRSQSATRAHPLLVSHPLPLVAFLVVEPPFPRFRSFQKYHRHTSPIPLPLPLSARSFNAPILPFVIYATGHRIRPPTLFSTSHAWKGEERSLAFPLHSLWIIRRFRNIVSDYLLNGVEGFFRTS